MANLPTGTVTFLFTDIEGSTRLLQQLGDAYVNVLAQYQRLLRIAVQERGGHGIETQGDALFVVFPSAREALIGAIAAQLSILRQPWPKGLPVRVRMGLHTGEALLTETGYVGIDVHRAARICDAGHGGQILLSETTHALVAKDLPEGVSLRDLGEHRLKDIAHPHRIFQVVAPHLPADLPPLAAQSLHSDTLPRQLTSFINRERDIAEAKRLLSSHCLLTLTGPGGCGKTRLALQLAADVLPQHADGVRFVELAPLSDPDLVPQTVARTLGVRELAGHPLAVALVDYLRSREVLLLLDNCEHVVSGCAPMTETLLQHCPSLRILVTSREPLGVAGEIVWRVEPLSFPERGKAPRFEDLTRYDAVRLFMERAAAALPTFELTEGNAAAVASVCQQLDGIPLAIELAAPRVRALPVRQIAARLNERFRLSFGPIRTGLPHHRTLEAAMEWSYRLLSQREQQVFRELSSFAGSWMLEAAQVVCTVDRDDAADIADLLDELIRKSLVLTHEQQGETRYRFLETVRQYALEKLQRSGEAPAVRTRHLEWCVGVAEEAEPELVGARQAEWLHRLEAEHDNIRTALEWSLASTQIEYGLRLAGAVGRFWYVRGYLAEGRRWLETVLEHKLDVAPAIRAKALRAAGRLAGLGQGDYAYSRLVYEESLAIWRAVGNQEGIATVTADLGVLAFVRADFESARALYRRSFAIWQEIGDRGGMALSLHYLGRVAYRQGGWDEAQTLFDESLGIWRELGDQQNIAVALTNLGFVAFAQEHYDAALSRFQQALSIQHELGDRRRLAASLEGFAFLAVAQGQPQRAARLFGAAEALCETIGAALPPVDRLDHDRLVALARAGLSDDAFAAAWEQGRAMPLELAIDEATRFHEP